MRKGGEGEKSELREKAEKGKRGKGKRFFKRKGEKGKRGKRFFRIRRLLGSGVPLNPDSSSRHGTGHNADPLELWKPMRSSDIEKPGSTGFSISGDWKGWTGVKGRKGRETGKHENCYEQEKGGKGERDE